MPRHYDYRCRACGHIELRYRNAQACRTCGSHEIERVRNEAPDTMLSAARTQIADLQRQLAEARADLRERETEIALMAARTGVHLRKIERLEQQLADAEADAQMMLELKRRSGERAQKVEALLYRGCNDCIYEPRNRNSDQCDGCDVWYGLLRAGIETERHGRTELNGQAQGESDG